MSNSQLRVCRVRTPKLSAVQDVGGNKTLICEEEEHDEDAYRIVKICPAIQERCFHSNDIGNVIDAVIERRLIPNRQFTAPKKHSDEIRATTLGLINRYFTIGDIENVMKWIVDSDPNYISKKWSEKRYQSAAQNARQRHIPRKGVLHTAAIKLEPHKPGKPPRLLVADGDLGQLTELLIVGVMEKRLFGVYEKESIKGVPKDEAIARVIQRTQMPGTEPICCMENDGSAFDFSVMIEVRKLVENVVLDRIQHVLEKHLVCGLISEAEAGKRAREKDTFQIRVVPRDHGVMTEELLIAFSRKSFTVAVDSMRRSGQRGTSSLNWLTSKVLGAWSIFGPNASKMMDKQATGARDVFGKHRKYLPAYEGDDQVATVSPPFTDDEVATLVKRWESIGFGMKVKICKEGDQIEFTGWKMITGPRGPLPGSEVPDLPRQLSHLPYCLSQVGVAAAKIGDEDMLGQIASATLISCAHGLALKAPSVAATLLSWANKWSDKALFSHDQLMKLTPEAYEMVVPEHWKKFDKVCDKQLKQASKIKTDMRSVVLERITSAWSTDACENTEAKFALQHGWCSNEQEWVDFLTGLQAISIESDDAEIRKITPAVMRGPVF